LPALVRSGVQVTVLVGSAVSQSGGEFERDGVRVIGLQRARFVSRLSQFPQLEGAPSLHRHVAAAWALHDEAQVLGDFDAVEVADWGMPGIPWLLNDGAPVLVRCHGSAGQIAIHEPTVGQLPLEQLLLSLERCLFARASSVVSYGEPNAAQWRQWIGRECLHREPAMPVAPASKQSRADWSLVLARVQRWKGPQVLGAALESMPASPSVRWVGRDVPDLAEAGPSTLAAMRRGFPRAWGSAIDWRDTVDSVTAAAWLQQARAVLVPSTWDVFNFAGAEAMASGAVVLASDAAALAQALAEMIAMNDARRERIGDSARHVVAQRADPDRVAAVELAAFRELQSRTVVSDPLDALLRPAAARGGLDGMLGQYSVRALLLHTAARVARRLRGA
jgi:hypothetical protein